MIFKLFCFIFPFLSYAQLSIKDWEKEALTNKRMLPKFGTFPKSEAEKNSDAQFVIAVTQKDSSRRNISNQLIEIGFKSMKTDMRTSMFKFNQAFLLDSTNSDIYWGYGAIYMNLGDIEKAKDQYEQGLKIDKNNPKLLTDYAACFMANFFALKKEEISNKSKDLLDIAIKYLSKSFEIDPKSNITAFKLAICYLNTEECEKAQNYYQISQNLGGIANEKLSKDLISKCPNLFQKK